jgi:hypothetical protein
MKTGSIRRLTDGRDYAYCLEFLDHNHVSAMLDLQAEILAVLPDKELFAPSNATIMARDLGPEGMTIGMFVENKLCGYMSLHWVHWDTGRDDELNLEKLIQLPPEKLPYVVRFRHTALHPHFQGGNAMMNKIGSVLLERARLFNPPLRYVCSLHSPKNYASLNYPFSQGMLAVKLIINRLGMYRFLCFQDFQRPLHVSMTDNMHISGADTNRLLQITDNDYCGYAISRYKGESFIVFGKRERPDIQGHR